MRRRVRALAVAVLAASLLVPVSLLAPASAGAAPVHAAPVELGSVTLSRCSLAGAAAWCGSVAVPLDYTDATAPSIEIGFGWIPAAGAARGTVVAQEGGPGYPSTGTAPDFAAMLGTARNLLVVDARGTGRSTPLDCEPLQSLPSPSPSFTSAVTSCGEQLNHTFRRADRSYVHASDLFTTANAARDLDRVLTAVALPRVDLYGDSYGTYFAQAFLARYPQRLRSVVLDSAYEARDLDPWYRTTVSTARTAFDAACARTPGCAAGSTWARIGSLTTLLRTHPATGTVVGTDATLHRETVGVTELVNIVNDAGYDTDPYRQLDAAARAYLEHGDAAPLLRLYAQDVGYDYSDYSAPAADYSDGLYMAVACSDYPQLFDMRSSVGDRRAQLDASIAALPADTFAPFTTREWLTVLPYTETFTGCLTWPAPTHTPDPPVPAGAFNPRHVPVLVLNGEFDSLTPAAGGAHVAAQLGSSAQAVVAANTVHLVALDNPHACGSTLVRTFLAAPAADLDPSCAARIPRIDAVPSFPRTLADVQPPGGATGVPARLRTVAVAAATDVLARYNYVDGNLDLGLRGGSVRYQQAGAAATLRNVRWTADTTVNGTLSRDGSGTLARLTVRGPSGVSAAFTFRVG